MKKRKVKTHSEFGWRKAISLYSWSKFMKASKYPLIISLASFAVCICSKSSAILYVEFLSDLLLNISPAVIGFLLSGYALIIGFSSNEVVRFMSKKKEGNKRDATLFQKQNVVFAIAILTLLVGLLFAVFTSIIVKSEINYFPSKFVSNIFNYTVVFILLFIIYFTIFAIKDMVINVFNFGQLIHHLIQKKINNPENNEE